MSHTPATSREPPPFRLRPLFLTVYLPTFLLALGQGAVLPVIPLFAKDLGASVAAAGFVFALRGVGTMVFDVPAGVAASRFGDRRTLIAGALAIVVVGIGSGTSQTVAQLALFTFLFGAGNAVFQVGRLAYISEVAPVQHRGRVIALMGGTNRVATFISPIAGGVLAKAFGLPAAFFLQAVAGGSAAILIFLVVRGNAVVPVQSDHSVYRRVGGTLSHHRGSFLTWGLAVITLQVIRSGRQILIPLWGDHVGLDVAAIGLVVGLSSGIDMLLFYPVGFVMDRFGRKWVAVPSLVVLSVGLALIPLAHSFQTLLVVGVLTGFGNGLGTGIVMTLGADLSPSIGRGEFLGVWRLVGDVGTAAGPFVIGAIAGVLTLGAASLTAAGVGLAGALFLALRARETLVRAPPAAAPVATGPDGPPRAT
jgi:MFS family permease